MLLLVLLVLPLLIWMIPFSRWGSQDLNQKKRFIINFGSMTISCLGIGILLYLMNANSSTLAVVLLSISSVWALAFHFFSRRIP